MKLSAWAKKQGISYRTAHRWFKDGKIPHKTEQMPSGTIIVHEETSVKKNMSVAIYARVSSYDRKDSLLGQIERCTSFANSKGLSITKIYKEIASGMNDNRPKLMKMLEEKHDIIIVEHKDRLTRFGFNYIEKLLLQQGKEIFVLNRDKEDETDLMKDMISIVTSFCCRLYGMRRGQNKASKIRKEMIETKDECQQ
jgi:putative resolvase